MSHDAHISAYAALIIDIVLEATNHTDYAPDGGIDLHRAAEELAVGQPDGVYHQVEELVCAMGWDYGFHRRGWRVPVFDFARYVTYMLVPRGVEKCHLVEMREVLERSCST